MALKDNLGNFQKNPYFSNPRFYLFVFLAFCVSSSKNILIYNEETLVASSFFLFVIFTFKYFGTTIRASLDERSDIIQQELQNFLDLKQVAYGHLLEEHQKVSGILHSLKNLDHFTNVELLELHGLGEKALSNTFTSGVEQRVKTLTYSGMTLQQKLQTRLSETVLSEVLGAFQQLKTKPGGVAKFQNKTIKNAIRLLVTHAK